ncbi:MAG: DUF547 domain-containing protein [Candidatus Binatia bacterium]
MIGPWRIPVKRAVSIFFLISLLAWSIGADSVEAGSRVDYDAYRKMLARFVRDGWVDYRSLKRDREKLDGYVKSLSEIDRSAYETWGDKEKVAFWINAYNGLTLKIVLDNYPIKSSVRLSSFFYPSNSIRQIPGAWDQITHPIMGRLLTLDQIEHEILRKQFNEPRIHFALVCASRSCAPLRSEPYVGEKLIEQLDDQVKVFLRDSKKNRFDREERVLYLSKIFQWFGDDFVRRFGNNGFPNHGKKIRAVLSFISHYLSPKEREFLAWPDLRIEYLPYDWSLNEQAGWKQANLDAGI